MSQVSVAVLIFFVFVCPRSQVPDIRSDVCAIVEIVRSGERGGPYVFLYSFFSGIMICCAGH